MRCSKVGHNIAPTLTLHMEYPIAISILARAPHAEGQYNTIHWKHTPSSDVKACSPVSPGL